MRPRLARHFSGGSDEPQSKRARGSPATEREPERIDTDDERRVPHPSRVCSGGEVRPLVFAAQWLKLAIMPWSLKRFQQSRQLHFVTFSCYRRRPLLDSPARRELFERALEDARRSYRFFIMGYVVMPEHVHLLASESERKLLATAIQAVKQSVARRLAPGAAEPFWQARYYDFFSLP